MFFSYLTASHNNEVKAHDAPGGGMHLSPRQHSRRSSGGSGGFNQVYQAVRDYCLVFPGKAVMYSAGGHARSGWAIFMAGGSFTAVWINPSTGRITGKKFKVERKETGLAYQSPQR